MADDGELRIFLLGPFEVVAAGRHVQVTSENRRALLAALALSAGRSVPADALALAVWGESPPASVKGSLQTLVMRLRRTLGVGVISTGPNGYRLEVPPDDVDVLRFLHALEEAENEDDPTREHEILTEALALWRGDLFAGLGSETLRERHRPRLTERYLVAVERRIDLDAGSPGELVGELRDLVARHPFREPLWERLVQALLDDGRTAEALSCYEDCRATLAGELGVDPGTRLRELHLRALAQDEPAVSPAVRPRQLPLDVAGFTGRVSELSTLDDFLAAQRRGSAAIALVEGAPGMGKTALAVRWANRVGDEFPDGQLFTDLRGHSEGSPVEPTNALDGMLQSLGVPAESVPATVEQRSALLRTTLSGRRVLVLLDNAASVDQIRPLLPGPGSAVLVTSRNQLRGLVVREGATRIPLGELSTEEATELLVRGLGRARVDDDAAAAATMTELCGRLPLAVSLAAERASRYPDLSLADLARELEDEQTRLDVLRDPTDADIRAAFSWSYRALSPDVARVFRLLSVHPGHRFGAESVAALCGTGLADARAALDELVRAHLLIQPMADRVQFHDLLRVYAGTLAAAADTTAALARVTSWYRQMAARLHASFGLLRRQHEIVGDAPEAEGLIEFADRAGALAWFQRERPAIVELVRRIAELGWHDELWRVAWLIGFAYRAGYLNEEWLEICRLGFASARALGDPLALFHSANNLAAVCDATERWTEGLDAYQTTLTRCRHELDDAAVGQILNNIGALHDNLGDHAQAYRFHGEALELRRADSAMFAVSLHQLAYSTLGMGEYAECVSSALEAHRLFEQTPHPFYAGVNAGVLAQAYAHLGDLPRARLFHRECVAGLRAGNFGQALVDELIRYGKAMAAAGQSADARAALLAALDEVSTTSSPRTAEIRALLAGLGDPAT